jgi:hypothetical protein
MIQAALETDGRMFVIKLMKHMHIEEDLFNTLPEAELIHTPV